MQQAQDMKEKMLKVEREIFEIRTMQLEMKKDGQPHVSLNSGKTDSIASNNLLEFQLNGRLSHSFIKYKERYLQSNWLACL